MLEASQLLVFSPHHPLSAAPDLCPTALRPALCAPPFPAAAKTEWSRAVAGLVQIAVSEAPGRKLERLANQQGLACLAVFCETSVTPAAASPRLHETSFTTDPLPLPLPVWYCCNRFLYCLAARNSPAARKTPTTATSTTATRLWASKLAPLASACGTFCGTASVR